MKAACYTRDAWESVPDGSSTVEGFKGLASTSTPNSPPGFSQRLGNGPAPIGYYYEPGTYGRFADIDLFRCHECNKQCRAPQGHEADSCAGAMRCVTRGERPGNGPQFRRVGV